MLESFLLYPLLAGLTFGVLSGPLGSYMVWRRLSFFGDTLAHGSLIGLSLGIFLNLGALGGILAFSLIISGLLAGFSTHGRFSQDTLLALLSQGALAVGLICLSFLPYAQLQLTAYLLGDILAVTPEDFWMMLGVGGGILGLLAFLWRPLLALTVSEEIASIENIPVQRLKYLFMMMVALTIAVALKIMGVLLMTALLIIPAATARPFAKTPEHMAFLASFIGCLAVFLGFATSYYFDLPTSPSIVTNGLILFIISLILKK